MAIKLHKRYIAVSVVALIILYWPYAIIFGSLSLSTVHDPGSRSNDDLSNIHIHAMEDGTESETNFQVNVKAIHPDSKGKVDVLLSFDRQYIHQLMRMLKQQGGREYKQSVADPGPPVYPMNISILLHNASLCSKVPDLEFIIYVHSSPHNAARRAYIRSTWADPHLFRKQVTQLVFIMGVPDSERAKLDDRDLGMLKEEIEQFGDIVIGDFADNYRNLTQKAVLGLKWVSQYCMNAKYAIKADDDAFLNVFELSSRLRSYVSHKRTIACPLWADNAMPILRDPSKCMKWCVSESDLPGQTHFPQYCAGLAFIISTNLMPELLTTALHTRFFWIDDVFLTGLVAGQLKGVRYIDLMEHFTLKEQFALDEYATNSTPISKYFVHIRNMQNMRVLWRHAVTRLSANQKALLNNEARKRALLLT